MFCLKLLDYDFIIFLTQTSLSSRDYKLGVREVLTDICIKLLRTIFSSAPWLLSFEIQVLLVIRALDIRGFISLLRGASISYPLPNFKAYYLRRILSRLIRECGADDKLSIKEFWRQFNIKMAIVIRFQFYASSLYAAIHRNATPAYNETYLYFVLHLISHGNNTILSILVRKIFFGFLVIFIVASPFSVSPREVLSLPMHRISCVSFLVLIKGTGLATPIHWHKTLFCLEEGWVIDRRFNN
jgi:hypothetical protein